ncbi:hypothetical protein GCM10020254_20130 [Streptomyces goshikiensis]
MSHSPALGFDPAPGNPAAVLTLAKKLLASANSLGEASRVVDALASNSSGWQGEAATAFRASLSRDLPRYLRSAYTSLAEAARRLTAWHDTLVAHRALAARYESQAAAATTEPALADARRLARELAAEHAAAAGRVAKTLNTAADRLAPKEPGVFASLWQKITEDPADALSNASAILGAAGAGLSLFCPPAGLAVMLVAGGLSLAALGMHAADPKFRKSLTDGVTKGEFDADFWKAGGHAPRRHRGRRPGRGGGRRGREGRHPGRPRGPDRRPRSQRPLGPHRRRHHLRPHHLVNGPPNPGG